MNFQFYKFCQSGIVTTSLVLYTFFAVLTGAHGFPWWASILLGLVGVAVGFFPLWAFIYPFLFGLYMLLALFFSLSNITVYFYVLIFVFLLHLVRFFYMARLNVKNPSLGRDYDEAIRYKLKP